MSRQSAGLLIYRKTGEAVEVFLVHPGGPFWAKKDRGVWSIPKGEFSEDEDALSAGKREFEEETGHPAPSGKFYELGTLKQSSGKIVFAWAAQGNLDANNITSNQFEMQWPPKSGQIQKFPEVDRAQWFDLPAAAKKIHPGQEGFLKKLAEYLKAPYEFEPADTAGKNLSDKQISLL